MQQVAHARDAALQQRDEALQQRDAAYYDRDAAMAEAEALRRRLAEVEVLHGFLSILAACPAAA
jgi:uncharacterized protein (DUF3084 family)